MDSNSNSRLIPLASLLGAIGIVAACDASENDPEGTGGTSGLGGAEASGGTAGRTGGTSGTTGSGGSAGSACPAGGSSGSGGTSATGVGGDAGGVGGSGEGEFECLGDLAYVCFGAPVATAGLPFVKSAWAFGNPEGVEAAVLRSEDAGKICMSGTNLGTVNLDLQLAEGDAPFTQLVENKPPVAGERFHAAALGITAMSFTIETPPSAGITVSIATAEPCSDVPIWGSLEQDGNPVVITSSGETSTFSLADFVVQDSNALPFDTNQILQLNFAVGNGPYDFCVSDLRFLDANGDEVTP